MGDTGGGIPQENLDNIFNPFFTTKQDGTGLGLAITHKIITQHGGELKSSISPGVGATFVDPLSPVDRGMKQWRHQDYRTGTVLRTPGKAPPCRNQACIRISNKLAPSHPHTSDWIFPG